MSSQQNQKVQLQGITANYLGITICQIRGFKNVSSGETLSMGDDEMNGNPICVAIHLEDVFAPGDKALPLAPIVLHYEGFKQLLRDLQDNEEHICACAVRGELLEPPS